MWTWTTIAGVPAQLNRSLSLLARLWSERVERGIGGVGTFAPNAATPVLGAARIYRTANTSATTITAFLGGTAGQEITVVLGDALTTIEHGTRIRLAGSTDREPATNSTLRLVTLDGATWLEVPR